MANAIQLRRGTTAEHSTFTGLVGEVTVDTNKDTIVVHDGATAGGVPLAKESDIPTASEILTALSGVDGAGSGLDADTLDGKQLVTIESEYQAYANSAAAAVVDAAPATLDTLNELAAALGDDPNFATTVTNSIATKASLSGATFTGDVAGTNHAITGNLSVGGATSLKEIKEFVTVDSSTSGTLTVDVTVQGVVYLTASQTANRTINFSNANSAMSVGESLTVAVAATQGGTAYYFNAYQVDGASVTPKWQGGSAPTEGNASGIDVYTFTIIKTANATFTLLASLTQYA